MSIRTHLYSLTVTDWLVNLAPVTIDEMEDMHPAVQDVFMAQWLRSRTLVRVIRAKGGVK